MITPGPGEFRAFYGYWTDANGDGAIDVHKLVNTSHRNEWVAIPGTPIFTYVEPGSHPTYGSAERPSSAEPDITYFRDMGSAVDDYGTPGDIILFTDGSLLKRMRTMTVTNPILMAGVDERFPFTPREDSLVDIDVYSAVAPGPVEAACGAAVAPFTNAVGSPSLGSCPNRCRVGPAPLGGTPAGAAQGLVWARYEPEWAEGSGSSGEGRLAEYQEQYGGWIDLLPSSRNSPSARGMFVTNEPSQLMGATPDGRQAAYPGCFSYEVWMGVWRDIWKDGRIGVADPIDPYQGGSRPLPDDYAASAGEFIGVHAVDETGARPFAYSINVTITPRTDWGPTGVIVGTCHVGTPQLFDTKCVGTWAGLPICPSGSERWHYTGDRPIKTGAGIDLSTKGRYGGGSIVLPLGTFGIEFDICVGPAKIAHSVNGVEVEETLFDCDTIRAWA
ncbi:MAG TPA: hypothetical protein VM889_13065 [Candidatus Thermoplasmatota archaeon]|nr:hypothetical protein [Candidatus Thermoplasmatota archaeon]